MVAAAGSSKEAVGGCRCGRLRFRVAGAPLFTSACHCRGCQRMTASAFSLSSGYPTDRFQILEGDPVIGGLHGAARHQFCGYCMSWVFTRLDEIGGFVNVRTTMLDDVPAAPPFLETFTTARLPWATTGAIHSFETFPPMERFQDLMDDYARTRGEAEGTL